MATRQATLRLTHRPEAVICQRHQHLRILPDCLDAANRHPDLFVCRFDQGRQVSAKMSAGAQENRHDNNSLDAAFDKTMASRQQIRRHHFEERQRYRTRVPFTDD